jgi:peptidoglycan hydrolase-like protein with peptidoglycan-binding domain
MVKRIQASVGFGGRNNTVDVMTAQYLLNCVPAARGGPSCELVIDGISGPLTMGAIRKFQSAALGRADGRIDPGGGTIRALLPYDPTPDQAVTRPGGVKMPAPPGQFAKSASYPPAYKSAAGPAGKLAPGKEPGAPGAWVKQPGAPNAGIKQPGAPGAWVKQPGAPGAGVKQPGAPGAWGKLPGKTGVGGKSGF